MKDEEMGGYIVEGFEKGLEQQVTKVCSRCKKELTLEHFYKFKNSKDGLKSECKDCQKEDYNKNINKRREYEKQYREEHKQQYKEHREKNKEKHKRYMNIYYENNREKFQQYAQDNKGKIYKRNKIYVENNREKIYERNRKRKKLLWKLKHTLKPNEWEQIKLNFNNKCAYCGQAKKLEHEHFIPISKGGEFTVNNIIPACKSCNSKKHNSDFFEWYPQQEFYSKERERLILKHLKIRGENDEK